MDWRVITIALSIAVTLGVLWWTISDWRRDQMDNELSGVTTGISPMNTVYPPRVR